jgi:uncharacterized protein YciI
MRVIILLLCVGIIVSCQSNGNGSNNDTVVDKSVMEFDSLLAKEIGADDYGMKQYVMAFLKRGPNRSENKTEIDSLQQLHMANIGKMAKEGKLVLAGPFLEQDYDVRGIYIFNTSSLDEAKEWTSTDPAIQAGSLTMELHPWYGSAGLMKVNELHGRISKIKF